MPVLLETAITKTHGLDDLFEDGNYSGWKLTKFETTPLVRFLFQVHEELIESCNADVHIPCRIC